MREIKVGDVVRVTHLVRQDLIKDIQEGDVGEVVSNTGRIHNVRIKRTDKVELFYDDQLDYVGKGTTETITTEKVTAKLEEKGYRVENGYIIFTASSGGSTVAMVDKTVHGQLSTSFTQNEKLTESQRKELLDILVPYALTPLSDREPFQEEKKGHLRVKGLEHYLNLDTVSGELSLADRDNTPPFKTVFTEKEKQQMEEENGFTLGWVD